MIKQIVSLVVLVILCIQTFCISAFADNQSEGANAVTRGEIAMNLWEEAGAPEPKMQTSPFEDVAPEEAYFKAVLWAYEWGITKGTSENTFSPEIYCTAEQMNLFKTRYEEKNLLEDAYMFTLPLMMMDATYAKMTNTVKATAKQAPMNQLVHAEKLATAEFKDVVTPNVDTVYSQVFLDLSENAVILEMPKTERFCTAQAMDAYTNSITVIDASVLKSDSEKFIFTGTEFDGTVPEGMTEVKCPTSIVWILIRTICFNEADEVNVHAIQNKMKTYTYEQYQNGTINEIPDGVFDEDNNFVPSEHVLTMQMSDYFTKANELMKENPPTEEDKAMMEQIKKINVGPELVFDSNMFAGDMEKMWESLVSSIVENTTKKSANFLTLNGQWSYMGEPIAEFGTEYAYRALISVMGLGANPVSVAVYPRAQVDSEGNRFTGINKYILHFEKDQLPPVTGNGFWSITAYTSKDNFLIDNEIDRYCINNRSDVIFNEDGSLDIYIQAEKPLENDSNWLPVSAEDFHLILRVYLPAESVITGQWKAPMISKIASNDVE